MAPLSVPETPTYNILFGNNGNNIPPEFTLGGTVAHNTDYTVFGNQDNYYHGDIEFEPTATFYFKFRLSNLPSLDANNLHYNIYKNGGTGNGIQIGITKNNKIGIFGVLSSTPSGYELNYELETNKIYHAYLDHYSIYLFDQDLNLLASHESSSVLINSGNGSNNGIIGGIGSGDWSQSPLRRYIDGTAYDNPNVDFFQGDMFQLDIYNDSSKDTFKSYVDTNGLPDPMANIEVNLNMDSGIHLVGVALLGGAMTTYYSSSQIYLLEGEDYTVHALPKYTYNIDQSLPISINNVQPEQSDINITSTQEEVVLLNVNMNFGIDSYSLRDNDTGQIFNYTSSQSIEVVVGRSYSIEAIMSTGDLGDYVIDGPNPINITSISSEQTINLNALYNELTININDTYINRVYVRNATQNVDTFVNGIGPHILNVPQGDDIIINGHPISQYAILDQNPITINNFSQNESVDYEAKFYLNLLNSAPVDNKIHFMDMDSAGNYLYLIFENDRRYIKAYDISDKTNISEIATYTYDSPPGYGDLEFWELVLDGDFLYSIWKWYTGSDYEYGIMAINISDHTSPIYHRYTESFSIWTNAGLYAYNNHLYLGNNEVYDVSDATNISLVGNLGDIAQQNQNTVTELIFDGNYAYALEYYSNRQDCYITKIDISDPSNMSVVYAELVDNGVIDMAKSGDYLYVYFIEILGSTPALRVYDISNTHSISMVAEYFNDIFYEYKFGTPWDMAIYGNYLAIHYQHIDFVSDRLRLVDISDPLNINFLTYDSFDGDFRGAGIMMYENYIISSTNHFSVNISEIVNTLNLTVNIDNGIQYYIVTDNTTGDQYFQIASETLEVPINHDYTIEATTRFQYTPISPTIVALGLTSSDQTISFSSEAIENGIVNFESTEVSKSCDDVYHIEWSCRFSEGTPPPIIVFRILRSYDPMSGFHNLMSVDGSMPLMVFISSGVQDPDDPTLYHYNYDDDFTKYNTSRTRYYKIEVYDSPFDEIVQTSKIFFIGDEFDGALDTIRHAEDLMYEFYSGSEFCLIKVSKSGEKCPDCWDPYQHVQKYHNCSTCNGTGYVNSVYNSHNVFINKDSDPNTADPQAVGEKVHDTIRCRMANDVLLDNRDILVEKHTGKRYQVTGSIQKTKLPMISTFDKQTTKADYTVSQLFSIKELDKDHEFYNINLNNITAPNEE